MSVRLLTSAPRVFVRRAGNVGHGHRKTRAAPRWDGVKRMAGTGGEGNEHVAARVPCLQRFTAVEFSKLRAPPPGQANTCGEKAETDLAALFLQYKCPARDRLPVSESLLLQTLRSDVSDVTGDRPCVTRGGGKDSADSDRQRRTAAGPYG